MRNKTIENSEYLRGLINATIFAYESEVDESIQDAFIAMTITPIANYYNVEFEYVKRVIIEKGDGYITPDFESDETAYTGFKILDTDNVRMVYKTVMDECDFLIEQMENLQDSLNQ